MFTSFNLQDYRGFKHYGLRNLSRVNLLVGRNSSGKTSLLEGIQLLASGGDPRVLVDTAMRRGEVASVTEESKRGQGRTYPQLSHFFHGHDCAEGARFVLEADEGRRHLLVQIAGQQEQDAARQLDVFAADNPLRSRLLIRIQGGTHPLGEQGLPVTPDGVLSLRDYHYMPSLSPDDERLSPTQFVAPDSLGPWTMSDMWNRAVNEGREREVTDALKILEPGVSDVVFLSSQPRSGHTTRAGIVVALRGMKRRVPLGTLGDGMSRLLSLSLGLVQSENGVLLVDEIDTGLHYSVMGDMWRMVVETAQRSNVQVFATTHSFDCVRGLGYLCESHPQLASEVSLQKIEPRLSEAVAVNSREIPFAVQQGIEMR